MHQLRISEDKFDIEINLFLFLKGSLRAAEYYSMSGFSEVLKEGNMDYHISYDNPLSGPFRGV